MCHMRLTFMAPAGTTLAFSASGEFPKQAYIIPFHMGRHLMYLPWMWWIAHIPSRCVWSLLGWFSTWQSCFYVLSSYWRHPAPSRNTPQIPHTEEKRGPANLQQQDFCKTNKQTITVCRPLIQQRGLESTNRADHWHTNSSAENNKI